MRKRLGIISLFIVLFIAFITIWNYSYYAGQEEAYVPIENNRPIPIIPSESGVFERSKHALDYTKMPIDEQHQRTMKNYYDNRAFHGAPPSIPHAVNSERDMGDNSCLKCHENGGYVEKYKAYTPVTPHPEKINCRQCHVPEKTNSLFKETNFKRGTTPVAGINNALAGSPPVIPHQLQLRENCLACHAGPSAPKEIRVSHPERVNCRQCHVPNNKVTVDVGDFMRKIGN
ncbi:nitrate reductase cytochrome c-type subunit [uncultured Tenacibaculum sp.]|uniref:nitrate reductase cytochrome c-type subunit n=1 Tax=uncultured Tenacibaculum sp. TaxID=174713 RepID=UPI0026137CA4|nr:nitrate reductase cytochrome c-type subunit [uncultured Tenacibaculum sp.]